MAEPKPIYEIIIEGRADKGMINYLQFKFLLHDIDPILTSKDIIAIAKKDDRYTTYCKLLATRGCTQIMISIYKFS
jgi:hypothetical protein